MAKSRVGAVWSAEDQSRQMSATDGFCGLEELTAIRREDALRRSREVSENDLFRKARMRTHHSLSEIIAARGDGAAVIAEMKQASPSAGVLKHDYDPAEIARDYQASGAVAISVLTEPHYFKGSAEHLQQARAACNLPILRKDFTSVPYQIIEAAAWGADLVLLIMAVLDDTQARELAQCAAGLGLDVLAESHDEKELERALELENAMIGVNSRNLRTLKTDLATAYRLAPLIPADRLAVAESGIRTAEDIAGLRDAGYRAFLIGESLLRGNSPGETLRRLTA